MAGNPENTASHFPRVVSRAGVGKCDPWPKSKLSSRWQCNTTIKNHNVLCLTPPPPRNSPWPGCLITYGMIHAKAASSGQQTHLPNQIDLDGLVAFDQSFDKRGRANDNHQEANSKPNIIEGTNNTSNQLQASKQNDNR